MATQENLNLAQTLYVAYYGRPADQAGLEFWADEIEASGAAAVVSVFGNSDEYVARFGDLGSVELINSIYQQAFNRDADEGGLVFYAEKLESGELDLATIALTIVENASNDDAQDATVLSNKVAAADAFTAAAGSDYAGNDAADYAAEFLANVGETAVTEQQIADAVAGIPQGGEEPTEPEVPATPGETFVLTEGRDNVTGTANDDTFVGDVGQNQNGAISNALSTGDRLDGAGGRNTIEASLINDNEVDDGTTQAPRPITQNIQEVYIEALQSNSTDGGNATLDVTRMENVEQYWSDFSRSDMTFSGVNLNGSNLNITKDVTFGMRDVDFDSGLRAMFESQSLVRAPATQLNSQLLVRIADVSTETPTTPLANVDLNLSFDLGGETVTLDGIRSTDGTYAGLVEALRAELAEAGQSDVEVALSTPYEQVTVAGNTVNLPFTAQEILITDAAGNEFSNVNFTQSAIEPVADGFLVAGNAQPVDPAVSSNLIETNLVLDNAGRGSEAGDVTIGGMSNSGTVIEKLNLEVDRSSKVDNVFSAYGMGHGVVNNTETKVAFEQIEVTSGAAQGDLSIANVGNVHNFDATAFEGANLAVNGLAGLDNAGSDNFGDDWEPNADARAHVYNTANEAGSSDTINVTYSLDKAAEFNGFSLGINTGAGDDTIHTISENTLGNNLLNQQDLQPNVTINAGSDNNTVWTEGAGGVSITTGTGNDVIYTDNSGLSQMNSDLGATWLVNAANTEFTDLRGTIAGLSSGQTTPAGNDIPAVLFGAQLTVTLAGAQTGGEVTSGAAAAFGNGFEGVINMNDILGDRIFGDQNDVNAAIMQVVNNHNVLSKLLVAENGPDNSLVIRSLVDGTFAAEDLQITMLPAGVSGMSSSDKGRLETAIRQEANDSSFDGTDANLQAVLTGSRTAVDTIEGIGTGGGVLATDNGADLTGSASTNNNTGNIVNAGAGRDVIVLSTDANSNETVVFENDFGRNTIVNFDADGTSAGADVLDFTAYLTNEQFQGGSTSAESRDAFATVGSNGGGIVTANNVITLNDFVAGTGNNSGQTWGNLTAENLLTAIQNGGNSADYGSLQSTTLDVSADITGLVGNSINAIVMIENNNNAGEYKVFELTGSGVNDANTANEFTGAELVGTVDFGNTVDASAVDLA
ncbi:MULTISPECIES: DUF4214 domain-containing protein [Halomonas]|uniref:DUF4214 domain-containing protein n=1 Tax=Halomonas TaxID=2745 RepID=UPI001867C215|nr:DUF4214 domain-containing protein [Halomonas citrativorans]